MQKTSQKIDIETIMSDIRSKVRQDIEKGSYVIQGSLSGFKQKAASSKNFKSLIDSKELNYINAHWHDLFPASSASLVSVSSHRKIIGKLIVKAKRFILNTVWNHLLKDYIDSERTYFMNITRYLNANARYIDDRIHEIFWQLIDKIDCDVKQVSDIISITQDRVYSTAVSLMDEVRASLACYEENYDDVRKDTYNIHSDLKKVDDLIRGVERAVMMLSSGISKSTKQESEAVCASAYFRDSAGEKPDYPNNRLQSIIDAPNSNLSLNYYLFENRYRGSEEELLEKQSKYIKVFSTSRAPILELGCGRGELLNAFKKSGLCAKGVDIDTAMCTRAYEKGLDVEVGDAFAILDKVADSSLGGIVALQFIEHLSNDQIFVLLDLCMRKLVSGGRLLFETVNTSSFTALAQNFFRDPTHRWPLHPETLRTIIEYKGFKTSDLIFSSPFPPSFVLTAIPVEDYLPARWQATLTVLNRNIDRLNQMLFGYQDYAIVAEKL